MLRNTIAGSRRGLASLPGVAWVGAGNRRPLSRTGSPSDGFRRAPNGVVINNARGRRDRGCAAELVRGRDSFVDRDAPQDSSCKLTIAGTPFPSAARRCG